MTARAPACSPAPERRVVPRADVNMAILRLPLEVASQAQVLVSIAEQFGIHRSMNGVADGAPFAHGLMLEHKRANLLGVALETKIPFLEQGGATDLDRLPLVQIMAIRAGDAPFRHRMMIRQAELAAFVQVTLEANLR